MFTTDDEAYGGAFVVYVPRRMGAKAAAEQKGVGNWRYSARGSLECPCHWPAAKVTQVERAVVAVFGSVTLRSS